MYGKELVNKQHFLTVTAEQFEWPLPMPTLSVQFCAGTFVDTAQNKWHFENQQIFYTSRIYCKNIYASDNETWWSHCVVWLSIRPLMPRSHDTISLHFMNGFQRNLTQIIVWVGTARKVSRVRGQRARSFLIIICNMYSLEGAISMWMLWW